MLDAEMERQHADARAALASAGPMLARVANSVRRTGRLVLTGMGASHFGNRVAEAALRAAGFDASAIPASELLAAPDTPGRRTLLLVSQSGESGEIVAWLDRAGPGDDEFGLTLGPDSRLARSRPSLLGSGGVEIAFAATRSLFLQTALLGGLVHTLTGGESGLAAALKGATPAPVGDAIEHLAQAASFVTSGRGLSQGVAEALALAVMELGRVPVLALEAGQLRHGPMEILGPKLGVVLLRAASDGTATAMLARQIVEAGSPLVVVDGGDAPPVAGAVTIRVPARPGIAGLLETLPTLQQLAIGLAARFVPDVGVPLRSTKVTRGL
jgi:fructoselysine-6-P-deglycase FrlB-like protein